VSVNISARQFLQQDVARWVLGVLDETALAGCWLELELTESLIAQDVEAVIDTIHALKEVGIKMSIDDFGTGYSSLSYLKRFRVDILKVHKSFVRDLLSDPDDAAIARAVISLGHSLGMKVIAEGVESAAQCAFLRTHGCDEIQGYYFSVPVPAARIAEMLASGLRLDMQAWGETSASVQSA
jgi:EAL domain-containing protein (putative c-di-GMP-specific phosphodiesterase class I)